jgi:type IV secretory pathway VirB10-like protein
MRSRLLISVSAAALIAGAGFATAQDKGGPSGAQGNNPAAAPQTTSPAQQSAPPASKGGSEMQQRQEAPPVRAQQDNNRGEPKQQRTQDQREQRGQQADDKSAPKAGSTATDTKSDRKGSATTGQGAAGGSANLTSEQRSKISTNIRQTNVKRETNVNFNISVGTVIPRTVTLHALPAPVIEVYPQWRGYRFVLVDDEIIIIEPGSYRIVAVIDA